MSTAGLIKKYVWLLSTVHNRGPISLADIQSRFRNQFGEELSERQFHRYTDAVESLFDIEIKFDRSWNGYVIADREELKDMGMRTWMIQTFSVSSVLHESQDLKNRILLEEVPSGQQHLTTIVDAMRESVALLMTYQSFWMDEPATFEVEPYCVKLFEQRWYMLGKSEGYDDLRIYALDRIKALEPTERKFKLPKKFDAAKFFEDYYGIIISDDDYEVCPVALQVDAQQSNYLRTLPLHHTQVEVERNDKYSIFEYRLCPTFDFRQKVLSMGGSVEVLAPEELVYQMKDEGNGIVVANMFPEMAYYEFKVYKK